MALAAVLGAGLLLTLAACSDGGDSNGADPTATPGNSATATAQAANNPPGDGQATDNGDGGTSVPPSSGTPQPTAVPSPSDARLTADGCAANCAFALNESFTLTLEATNPPSTGYVGVQSFIEFGDLLTYDPTLAEPAEEIVWPDCADGVALRSDGFGPTMITHGCLTGLIPPLPASTATGPLVQFTLTCSAEPSQTTIRIVPQGEPGTETSGTAFAQAPDGYPLSVPSVNDLTVDCG